MNIIKKERLIALALVFAMLIMVYVVALYKLQIIEGEKYYGFLPIRKQSRLLPK